jgi:hypothetical protein
MALLLLVQGCSLALRSALLIAGRPPAPSGDATENREL